MLISTDRLLREPALLVPGRKPVGAVGVRDRHLAALYLLRGLSDHAGRATLALELDIAHHPATGLSLTAGNEQSGAGAAHPALPLAASAPWTLACRIRPHAYVSLAGVWGICTLDADNSAPGAKRHIIQFSNNYYLWGGGADWDTGIAWDTDSQWHTIVFTCDGTNLRFYRDGVLRAGPTARPGGWVTTVSTLAFGYGHPSMATAANCDVAWGAFYSRALPAPEVAQLYRDPFALVEVL